MTDSALLAILNSKIGSFPIFQGIKRDILKYFNALLEKMGDFRYRSIKNFWFLLKDSQSLQGDAKG